MQVNLYGVLSFGSRASYNDPRLFPLSSSDKIIAPFNDAYNEYAYDVDYYDYDGYNYDDYAYDDEYYYAYDEYAYDEYYDYYDYASDYHELALFRLSDNQALLNEIGSTVNNTLEVDFTPTMLFIVTWNRVPEYGNSLHNV